MSEVYEREMCLHSTAKGAVSPRETPIPLTSIRGPGWSPKLVRLNGLDRSSLPVSENMSLTTVGIRMRSGGQRQNVLYIGRNVEKIFLGRDCSDV